jgi:4-hydroxybenzoate polyprenyltransferase
MGIRLRDLLTVSRAEIQIASLPTPLIGAALAAGTSSDLLEIGVLLYVLLFFVILTFACNLNCLADRDVDALFKKRMSDAVAAIGTERMRRILAVEAVLAAGLTAALALIRRDPLILLGLAALVLAAGYSTPPLRLKKRGWLSPWPVALGLYALPPIGGWYIVRGNLGFPVLAFALGYALLMEGITIVNTCEDYAEDASLGIKTLAHALGIRRTLTVGAWLAGAGGIVALAGIAAVFAPPGQRPPVRLAVAAALMVYYFGNVVSVFRTLRGLSRSADIEGETKLRAKSMAGWFLKTRYPLLLLVLILK